MNAYDAVIARKIKRRHPLGFNPILPLNKALFDWQSVIVLWAIRNGRCALFEDCGLGKTLQSLEWARQVVAKTSGPVLILCPLAVAEQTVREGDKFDIAVRHVRGQDEIEGAGIHISNYERLGRFDPQAFAGVVLDESSILKSLEGKTRRRLTEAFADTPYRLCCTATPAPNDYAELGQHAEFLGVCSTQQMLATWFVNDTSDTGTWRLKGHSVESFWRWVASWAACVSKPSDLGYPDGDFKLPELKIEPVVVPVDRTEARAEGELFRTIGGSACGIHAEMRLTCAERVAACAEIVNASDEAFCVWCNTNYEADALKKAIPDAVEVRGSDDPEEKEAKLVAFSSGLARVIVTKPSIAGYGLNWQHCRNACYVGLSYSFEDFYQSIRRIHRYGQKRPVSAYIVQAETETEIMASVMAKADAHEGMRVAMRMSAAALTRQTENVLMKTDLRTERGRLWEMHHGDCVRFAERMADESIGFAVFSPPFSDLFTYSADMQDMGNNATLDDFFEQFEFLVSHLYRVLKPGRLCAVHCSDLTAQKWKDGEIELKNFSGRIVDAFRSKEWLYHTRVTIWKDPVIEMQRTKALGLLHKQLLKDSAMCRVGNPEYILVFRKPGVNAEPIAHDREDYPVALWQKDASPVWMDIDQTRVLNAAEARGPLDEKHICPLQLDVIERCLRLWSNPGDTVFSPFAGIGSEGVCAVRMRRKFVGVELKESYFETGCANLRSEEAQPADMFLDNVTVNRP